MMESSADTHMYLRYEATVEEGARSNDVEDRTCQAALGRRIFLLSIEDVIRLPELFGHAMSSTKCYMIIQQEFCCFACSIESECQSNVQYSIKWNVCDAYYKTFSTER